MPLTEQDRKLLKIGGVILSIFSAIIFIQTINSEGSGNLLDNFLITPIKGLGSFILFWIGIIITFVYKPD